MPADVKKEGRRWFGQTEASGEDDEPAYGPLCGSTAERGRRWAAASRRQIEEPGFPAAAEETLPGRSHSPKPTPAMSPWQLLLLSSLSAAFALTAWRHLRGIRALRRMPVVEPLPPRHWERDDYWPMLSVLVEARAAAGHVEACIESLRSQDYPRYEILLAVPEKERASWAWLERFESENGRLRLVPVAGAADSQTSGGVSIHEAVDHARGSWLLFARGNETFHPACLTSLVREALQHRTDLVGVVPSVAVRPARGTGLLAVAGAALSVSASPFPLSVARVEGRTDVFFAGDSMLLVRRASYDEVGGFDRSAPSPAQALHLARSFRDAGLRTRVVLGADVINVNLHAQSVPVSIRTSDAYSALIGESRRRWLALSVNLLSTTLFPFLALGIVLGLQVSPTANSLGTLFAVAGLLASALQGAHEFLVARTLRLPWMWVLSRATTLPTAAIVVGCSFPRRPRGNHPSQPLTDGLRTDPAESRR